MLLRLSKALMNVVNFEFYTLFLFSNSFKTFIRNNGKGSLNVSKKPNPQACYYLNDFLK